MDDQPPTHDADDSRQPDRAVPDPSLAGPLDRATALAYLTRADALLAADQSAEAGRHYRRVVGFPEAAITAAGLLGSGNVLSRLGRADEALASWRGVLEVGDTPAAYPALRSIGAELVRRGDHAEAERAYRTAATRAPAADLAEIEHVRAWLAGGADGPGGRGALNRRRQGIPLTYLVLGITVVVSLAALTPDGTGIFDALSLDKSAVAGGQWWRLASVVLLHANLIHLFFNMYALFLVGPLVERIYGPLTFAAMYLACGFAASAASFALGDPTAVSVGASGAIFGLFGVLFAAFRAHAPELDRRSRALVGQIGLLIVVNLAIGLGAGGAIDNMAHVGGLVAGLWLGFWLVPGRVPTRRTSTSAASGLAGDLRAHPVVRLAAVVAVIAVAALGVIIGSGPSRFTGG